jgi:hypothetical protein
MLPLMLVQDDPFIVRVVAGGPLTAQEEEEWGARKVGAEVPRRERPLFRAGFKHVGDVVCSAFEEVAVRGYARPGGDAWAYFRVSAPCEIEFEIASTFPEHDGVLVTTATANERHVGAPQPVTRSLQSLAETLEAVRLKS